MSFESGGGQKFPYTYDQVFTGLLRVLPEAGFKIKEQDKGLGRFRATSGMSLLSFGENIDISVEDIDGYSTRVEIHSGLKIQGSRQAIITGEHRNNKNVNEIIFALNNYLKTQTKPQKPTAPSTATPPTYTPPPPPTLYVSINGEAKGPFTNDQVKALLSVNTISSTTPCCREGSQVWETVGALVK